MQKRAPTHAPLVCVFMHVHILGVLAAGPVPSPCAFFACAFARCADCNLNFRIIHRISLEAPRGAREIYEAIYATETLPTPSPPPHSDLMWTVKVLPAVSKHATNIISASSFASGTPLKPTAVQHGGVFSARPPSPLLCVQHCS